MKQTDWTQWLRKRLADHEEVAPDNLWADIESKLNQSGLQPSPQEQEKKARLVPVWGRRIAVAAIFLGLLAGIGVWLKQTSEPMLTAVSETQQPTSITHEESVTPLPMTLQVPTLVTQQAKQSRISSQEDADTLRDAAVVREEQTEMTDNKEEHQTDTSYRQSTLPVPQTTQSQQPSLITKKVQQEHRKYSINLYAQNGFSRQETANGVLMSPQMAANYDYNALAASATRRGNQMIYLANYEEQQKHYQPISFGVTANIPILPRLSLTTGIVYTRLRSDFVNVMAGCPLQRQQTLHYVGLPLSLNYQLWNYMKLGFYASAGGQADYNVKAQMVSDDVEIEMQRDRWQFSLQGALGIEYRVISPLALYVEPGLKYYFDNGSRINNFFKDTPVNFNLQVGIRLHLGDR